MPHARAMAAWQLPWSLRFDASLSGAILETPVDGALVELHLPLAEPFSTGAAPEVLPAHNVDGAAAGAWTTTVEAVGHAPVVTVFDVHRIVFVEIGASIGRVNTWIGRELDAWFAQLTDWLEVWTGQVTCPAARRAQQPVWGDGLERWLPDGDGWRHEASRVVVDCAVPESHEVWGRPATHGELVAVLERVASGDRPMLRDLLIRDAQVHLLSGEARRAALDAGLAGEVMLAVACTPLVGAGGKLPGEPGASGPPLNKATLGPLVAGAPQLGVSIPAALTQELVEVRNSAAHGRNVSAELVRNLLDAVIELRSLLVPDWMDEVDRRSPV